jgi:hypothetical protein
MAERVLLFFREVTLQQPLTRRSRRQTSARQGHSFQQGQQQDCGDRITKMTNGTTINDKFQHYCVLFADILNQAEKVDRLRHVPNDQSPLPAYIEKLRQTAGVIVSVAGKFSKTFNELKQIPQSFKKTPEAFKKDFIARTSHPISRQLFSDSMLYFLPVDTEDGQCPEWAIYKIFFAAYAMYLDALITENPLRGAITFGYAGVFGENGLYGPALLDAYRLESNSARYPRIVVQSSFVQELRARARMSAPEDIQANISAYFSEKCLKLLVQDADGLYVIDPQNSDYREDHKGVREEALRFVNRELVRFQSIGSAKLAGRYQELSRLLSPERSE